LIESLERKVSDLTGEPKVPLITETKIEVKNFVGKTKLKDEKADYEKTAEADV